ncbi:MAG TPA: hypothetical protein VN317_10925 [Candidatus Methanoperedens sp.]|nr:hypothetical protein [Candidatus Methanoperedens sp.]
MKTRGTRFATLAATAALAAALALAPLAARAEEAAGKGTFSAALASRYIWRGQTLSEGVVVQPTVGITLGGFAANLWSNVDLDNGEEDDDGIVMKETDLTLSYSLPIGPVNATAGFIHYDFDGGDTQELYLTCALSTLLSPTLSLYYDIDEGDGGFAVLGVSHAFPVGPVSLTAGGSVGFNLGDGAMGVDEDGDTFTGLYYGEVSLATSIPIFKNVSLDPRLAYSSALGDHGEHAIKSISVAGQKDMLYGSLAITAAF